MRRLTHWNEHNLFRKKDALTGKEIFSSYPEASPIKIYDREYWWSDAFDAMKYGRDYDFSQPFFAQLKDLVFVVPRESRQILRLMNSDFCDLAGDLKNCYLCFNGDSSEDCLYGVAFKFMRGSIDFYQSSNCELCYELFSVSDSYQTFFSAESDGCRDSWFLLNCHDCSNCFGCVNLRHKQYHIFNVPYTKEDYFKKLAEFNLGSYAALQDIKQKVRAFWLRYPMRYMRSGTQSVNVKGDYIYQSKNVHHGFQVLQVENARYVQNVALGAKDVMDYTNWGNRAELIYEAVNCGEDCRNVKFAVSCWPASRDIEYSLYCRSSANLFGCVGLKKKEYCIFNKQFTPEKYKSVRAKIIEHMRVMPYTDSRGHSYSYGEFFPPEFSAFAYNETAANDYYPLTKNEAMQQGFVWRDPEPREYHITLPGDALPDHVNDATEAVTKEIIGCASCKKAFRIVPQEFAFYKRFGLPLPRKCHNCRYEERIKMRNPARFQKRTCQCAGMQSDNGIYKNAAAHFHSGNHCPNEFETSYAPERPEIVYCETCYQSEVA